MRRLALLGLCACNQIFGLSGTKARAVDAQYFDAPADAPYSCPPLGTQPAYGKLLHQVIQQNCWGYTIDSADALAIASCYDQTTGTQISSGEIDQPMTPVTIQTKYAANLWYQAGFTLDPQIFILAYDMTSMTYSFQTLERGVDGTWTDGATPMFPWPYASGDSLTVPSRGAGRHMLYYRQADQGWYELVESAPATWTIARALPYKLADLGEQFVYEIQMTDDGLHMIAYAEPTGATMFSIVYTSRPSVDADWPPFQPLPTVPAGASYPFVTDDCARVYFSGLSSVLYVQQQ